MVLDGFFVHLNRGRKILEDTQPGDTRAEYTQTHSREMTQREGDA